MSGLDLRNLDLRGAKLPSADLQLSDLSESRAVGALLEGANLKGTVLRGAELASANLRGAFLEDCDLSKADLMYADLSGAHLSGATFDHAYLHRIVLSDATEGAAANWSTPAEMHDASYDRAAQVFRNIGSHYRSLAAHTESAYFYFREMEARHLFAIGSPPIREHLRLAWLTATWAGIRKSHPLTSIAWAFHRFFWGYGIRPGRVLAWMIVVILFFGLAVYPFLGVERDGVTEHTPLTGIALSIVTFATLGYGNRVPSGPLGELLGGLEALVGVLLCSAFLVALATRYVHRG